MQQSNLTIRRAVLTDADLLAELGARTFSETFAADNKPEDMAAYLQSSFSREQLTEELSEPGSTFFIAEIDGVAAGYAKLQTGVDAPPEVARDKPIELARLYVLRAWLGRRVGEALMRASVDEARRAGYQTMWLGVWEHNARARAFYRKWNFSDVGSHIFQLGEDAQTDILMARPL